MLRKTLTRSVTLAVILSVPALAQQQITSVTFDSIPEGTEVVGGGPPILLDSDTDVNGEVSTTQGVRFGDGTLQTTAAASTPHSGIYSNRIPDFTPPNAYTEICFKAGATMFDIHSAAEPTTGGNCLPGDTGWVIERFERDTGTTVKWAPARAACLRDGMRLPDPFEYLFTCDDAALYAVTDVTEDYEWISSPVVPLLGATAGVGTTMMGGGACDRAVWGWLGQNVGPGSSQPFRCAL